MNPLGEDETAVPDLVLGVVQPGVPVSPVRCVLRSAARRWYLRADPDLNLYSDVSVRLCD